MMNLIDTRYGVNGDELARRNGARAMNVVMSTLRDLGRDQLPITDRDYQISTMIQTALNGLEIGEIAVSPVGSVVSVQQIKASPALDRIEHSLESALGLIDDAETALESAGDTFEKAGIKLPNAKKAA